MALELGRMLLREVHSGSYALDGGTLFGPVPRALWQRELEPDAQNRVHVVSRCLLIDVGKRRILVDAGPGQRWTEPHRGRFRIAPDVDVVTGLSAQGITPDTITDVVITHLHWDHAGGLVRKDGDGRLELTFPGAVHHIQRRNWRWAHLPSERDRRAYLREDYELLERSGRVHFVEGEMELVEDLFLMPSDGHTVGQQLVRLEGDGRTVLMGADILPTACHVHFAWSMGYDLYPLTVIEEKKQILAQALEERWILFLQHDPRMAACTVAERDGEVTVDEIVRI